MTRPIAAIAALFAFVFSGSAAAQTLTSTDIERFITAMKSMEEIGERYSEEELEAVMPDIGGGNGLMALLDEDGNMAAFSRMADAMEKAPASPAINDVRKAVKNAGFSSISAFGETGDAVTMALLALEVAQDGGIDKAQIDQMRNMPAEMKAMMPPGAMAQFEAAVMMIEATKSVPPANIDAVKPYRSEIENAFGG